MAATVDLEMLLDGFKTQEKRKMGDYIDSENFHETHGVAHIDFVCQVCLCLRDQVKKCSECEVFICEPCLNKIKELSCPNCRNSPFTCVDLSRLEQNHLNLLNFKCKTCDDTFNFKERRKHMQTCEVQVCPAGCKINENALDHINSCSRLIHTCKCCVPVIVRSDGFFCPRKAIK